MAKTKNVYVCNSCGAKFPKWQGQCGECGQWQTLVEEVEVRPAKTGLRGTRQGERVLAPGSGGRVVMWQEVEELKVKEKRILSGIGEFDRVLGGGIVVGSVVLVGGEPGIGKSTLLTQLALKIGFRFQVSGFRREMKEDKLEVLYVCGEESVEQVGLRIRRLRATSDERRATSDDEGIITGSGLGLMAEMDVDRVIETAKNIKPSIIIIDSIQTLFTTDLSGMAGSVGQVRECAYRLIEMAKTNGIAIFIVGHITKEGTIAGPKVLEHMVDCVLYLEGERKGLWRLLRANKNRFGPVDEVGVFAMETKGMKEVSNPSGAFLEERKLKAPGSAVVAVMEGSRPVLIEVQALVVKSQLAMPRRVAQGISLPKLQLLTAVLQKHCRLDIGECDVFVNVVGGIKINEPAADLGVAMAIASSFKNTPLKESSVFVGEVGLLGEIRRVAHLDRRVSEAKKLGYEDVVGPGEYSSLDVVVKKLG